jgi:DNA invertase Pin-like site-specific DNA recombinase
MTDRYGRHGRLLSASEIEHLKRAMAAGTPPGDLARELGVSKRTVYRWRQARIERVEASGWWAFFALRPDSTHPEPVQVSAWFPVDV